MYNLRNFDSATTVEGQSNAHAFDIHRKSGRMETNKEVLKSLKNTIVIRAYKTHVDGGVYLGIETQDGSFLAYEFTPTAGMKVLKEKMINAAKKHLSSKVQPHDALADLPLYCI